MLSFRIIASTLLLILTTSVGVYVLRFDYFLKSTPNYHWVFLLASTVIDIILAFELILTSQLRLWTTTVPRLIGGWAMVAVIGIIADALLSLQLPANYPPITLEQSSEYLLLGINGNPIPFGVPVLLTSNLLIAFLMLLPERTPWFKTDSFPTRRTLLAFVFIVIIVMGARPAFIAYAYARNPFMANSSQIINAPTKQYSIPYDSANATVFLTLVAEANPMMPYNYNNTDYGQLVFYVPANWSIRLHFINDEGMAHSAVFVRAYATTPLNLTEDSTVLAQIPNDAMQGGFLVSGGSGAATVHNLTPGTYWVACALSYPTSHAQEGMWVTIKVSTDISAPFYTIAS